MLKQTAKRGFTITELIIVIVVIAILAAVLIPTFASLIKKANMSADQQAVRQMNTILTAEETVSGKPATIGEAIVVLVDNGINANNYKPLTVDTDFFWVKAVNRVVHADADHNILYPKASSLGDGAAYAADNWFPLHDTFFSAEGFLGGEGTSEDPYLISTGEQMISGLIAMSSATPAETVYYELVYDIVVPEYDIKYGGSYSGWQAGVPNLTNAVFDGNGHTLDMKNNTSYTFVDQLVDSTIKDLKVTNLSTPLVSLAFGGSTLENVDIVAGTIDSNKNTAGYVAAHIPEDWGGGTTPLVFKDCDAVFDFNCTTPTNQASFNAVFVGQCVGGSASAPAGQVITNDGRYLNPAVVAEAEIIATLSAEDIYYQGPAWSHNACHINDMFVYNLEFTNCSYSGTFVSPRAAMFIGNSGMCNNVTLKVTNCVNKGTIQATYQKNNDYTADWYYYEATDTEWDNPDLVNYFSANGIGNGEKAQKFTLILDGTTYQEYNVKDARVTEAGGSFVFAAAG